jgi:hypothetical protein
LAVADTEEQIWLSAAPMFAREVQSGKPSFAGYKKKEMQNRQTSDTETSVSDSTSIEARVAREKNPIKRFFLVLGARSDHWSGR